MALVVAADDADAAAPAAADSRKVCCPCKDNLVSRLFAAGGTGEGISCWFGKDVSKTAGGIGGACIEGIATSKTDDVGKPNATFAAFSRRVNDNLFLRISLSRMLFSTIVFNSDSSLCVSLMQLSGNPGNSLLLGSMLSPQTLTELFQISSNVQSK